MIAVRVTGNALLGRVAVAAVCVLVLGGSSNGLADIAFQYDPIQETITSAWFSVDFAAMNAHRMIGEEETNFVRLVDCQPGGGLHEYDVSDELFGTAAFPEDPQVDMGPLETGIFSAPIDSSFFPELSGGRIGLRALFTDTVDAMFAMDFLSLTIETSTGMTESYYGWPVGNENNGFGLDPEIPDGGDLPGPLPDSIPAGATGTGFDEVISSKSFYLIPEPGTLALLALGGLAVLKRWR